MADEVAFNETQVAADGKRYAADDIDKVNRQIAKGDTPQPLSYEPTPAVQRGSGTATGVQGDQLSGDHASVASGGHAEAKADDPGEAKSGEKAASSKEHHGAK